MIEHLKTFHKIISNNYELLEDSMVIFDIFKKKDKKTDEALPQKK